MPSPDFFGITDTVKRLTAPAGYEAIHRDGYSWARAGTTYEDTTRIGPEAWNQLIGNFRALLTLDGVIFDDVNPFSPYLLRDTIVSFSSAKIAELLPGAVSGLVPEIVSDEGFQDAVAAKLPVELDLYTSSIVSSLVSGRLEKAENLADLDDAAEARDNLGLGTAATAAAADLVNRANHTGEDGRATFGSRAAAIAAHIPAGIQGLVVRHHHFSLLDVESVVSETLYQRTTVEAIGAMGAPASAWLQTDDGAYWINLSPVQDITAHGAVLRQNGSPLAANADAIEAAGEMCDILGPNSLLYSPPGPRVEVDRPIVLTGNYNIHFQHRGIRYNGTDNNIVLTIGRVSANVSNPIYRGLWATRSTQTDGASEDNIGIQLINIYSSPFIEIVESNGHTVGIECMGHSGRGFVYNKIHLGRIGNCKIGLQANNDNSGWANENQVFGGRFYNTGALSGVRRFGFRFTSKETYVNNAWTLYSPSIEIGSSPADNTCLMAEFGADIRMLNYRSEVTPIDCETRNNSMRIDVDPLVVAGGTASVAIRENGRYDGIRVTGSSRLMNPSNLYGPGATWSSGPLVKAHEFNGAGQIGMPGCAFGSTSDANMALNGASSGFELRIDGLLLKSTHTIGRRVDTRVLKKLMIKCNSTLASLAPRYLLRCYGENGRTVILGPTTSRANSTVYSLGDLVQVFAGECTFFAECTTAGTSAASGFSWPTYLNDGDTVADGTVVWTLRKEYVRGVALDAMQARSTSHGGVYSRGANTRGACFISLRDEVKFVDVLINSGNISNATLHDFSITTMQPNVPLVTMHPLGYDDATHYISAPPATAGYVRAGERYEIAAPTAGNPATYVGTTSGWMCNVEHQVSTAVSLGAIRYAGSNVYICTTAGTTGASSPPTGTGSSIADGTVVWAYVAPHGAVALLYNMAA